MKKIFVIVLSVFVMCLALVELCTLNKSTYSEDGSLYYLDSLQVSKFEENNSIKFISCSKGLEVRNGYITMKDSVNYSEACINQYVVGVRGKDTLKVQIKLRSWINGDLKLIEIDKFRGGYISRHSKRITDFLKRKVGLMYYEFPLYTNEDYSILAKNGKLYRVNKETDSLIVVCDCFILEDPIYNMMEVFGSLAFIRTGTRIYFSNDNMKTWREIYRGKRQVSEQMFFRSLDSTLVFSEYTSGTTRDRHCVISYDIRTNMLDTTMTFYSTQEYFNYGLEPYCRHIHVMKEDPYSGDIYLGTGDSDSESAIYRSTDGGVTFVKLGTGSQKWRTLTFLFDEKRIYWTMDSSAPQYICGIDRSSIDETRVLSDTDIDYCVPIINSALWNSLKINEKFFLVSCDSAGAIYDDHHYIFGVELTQKPVVYNLISEKTITFPYHKLFLIGVDCNNLIWCYDTGYRRVRKFKLSNAESFIM